MRDTQLLLTTSIFPSFELEYIPLNRYCRSTCQCHSYFISHKKKVFPSLGFSLFLYPLLCWLGSPFFPLTLISLQFALSISGLCLCMALGIKSDSLRDWMCLAMASCIWKAIHSAGTLQFNLKQDWCWQTSHPLSSKMFPPLHAPIADGLRACATL